MKHFQCLSFIATDESGVVDGQRQDATIEVALCSCKSECEAATSGVSALKAALLLCLYCFQAILLHMENIVIKRPLREKVINVKTFSIKHSLVLPDSLTSVSFYTVISSSISTFQLPEKHIITFPLNAHFVLVVSANWRLLKTRQPPHKGSFATTFLSGGMSL